MIINKNLLVVHLFWNATFNLYLNVPIKKVSVKNFVDVFEVLKMFIKKAKFSVLLPILII